MIQLTIDGQKIGVKEGATVLDAARKAGVYVPTLCDHEGLFPFGACRLCIVEIEGRRGVVAACSTPAGKGMKVRTDSPAIRKLRRGVMELLLTEHPNACLACAEKWNCGEVMECQRKVAVTMGCKNCPKTGQCEIQNIVHSLWGEKGPRLTLPSLYRKLEVDRRDPFMDRDDNLCILCGRCVRVCGEVQHNNVLEFTHRGSESRIDTAFNKSQVEAGCKFCGACIEVCPTGALSERVRRWDGPVEKKIDTTCSYCSMGCQLEVGVKSGRVIDALPKKNAPVNAGQACVRGRFAVPEFVRSVDRVTSPMIRRDGELVEVPLEVALKKAAEGILASKPENSALVYSGSCTNEDVYAAHKFAKEVLKTSNVDGSARLSYGPLLDDAEAYAKVATVSEIEEADSVLVVGADPEFSHPVLGYKLRKASDEGRTRLVLMGTHETGLSSYAECDIRYLPGEEGKALDCLLGALKGEKACCADGARAAKALKAKSVAVIYGTGLMRRLDGAANLDAVERVIKELKAKGLPLLSRANDRGAAEIATHFGAKGLRTPEILLAERKGKLDLLYLVGEDVWAGKHQAKTVIVQDMFLPPEARKIADVVLPIASFTEIEGTYVNFEGRVQRVRPAVKPAGNSKQDWRALSLVAKTVGAKGFDWDKSSSVSEELCKKVGFFKGLSLKAAEKRGGVFGKASKASRKASRKLEGRPPMPERPDRDYPFALVAEYDEYAYKSTPLGAVVSGIRRLQEASEIVLSPEDAKSMGISAGSPVRVVSRRGHIEARAKVEDGAAHGVARMVARGGESSPANVFDGLLDPASKAPEEMCAVRIEKI